MKIEKVAGIDLGSNSVRLLISNVIETNEAPIFRKSSLTRLPIRLGEDTFGKGKISQRNITRLIAGMHAYSNIMKVHEIEYFRACATSALREAENGEEVVDLIEAETGIRIELISGKEEAEIIFNSGMINIQGLSNESFLYIDVGGGSTELTLFHKNKVEASRSFKIGTIRLLQGMVKDKTWEKMKDWIKDVVKGKKEILMVGSGGNINRTLKLAGKSMGSYLDRSYLEDIYSQLISISTDERIIKFDLNPDRADVITHALRIYKSAMKWAGSERIIVPKKGLADGLVRHLYRQEIASR